MENTTEDTNNQSEAEKTIVDNIEDQHKTPLWKNRKIWIVSSITVIITFLIAGGYWYWQNQNNGADTETAPTVTPTNAPTKAPTPTEKPQKAFTHEFLPNFELSYDESKWNLSFGIHNTDESGELKKIHCEDACMELVLTNKDITLSIDFVATYEDMGFYCSNTVDYEPIDNNWYRIKDKSGYYYVYRATESIQWGAKLNHTTSRGDCMLFDLNENYKQQIIDEKGDYWGCDDGTTYKICDVGHGIFISSNSLVLPGMDGDGVPLLMEKPKVNGEPDKILLEELDQIIASIQIEDDTISPNSKYKIESDRGQALTAGKAEIYDLESNTIITTLDAFQGKAQWLNDNEIVYIRQNRNCDEAGQKQIENAVCDYLISLSIAKYVISKNNSVNLTDTYSDLKEYPFTYPVILSIDDNGAIHYKDYNPNSGEYDFYNIAPDETGILQKKITEQIELSKNEVTMFNTYDVVFDTIKISESGDWGKAIIFYKDNQTGETVPTEGDLILAKKVQDEWHVLIGLTHSSEWDQWVQDVPEDIISSESKDFWKNRY